METRLSIVCPPKAKHMKKLLLLLAALVVALAPAPAAAGTCDSAYADSLPQTSGSAGAVPTSSPWTSPGQIVKILATGDGLDVTYQPTSGSPVTSHISFGYGVTCTHRQLGGWDMPAPSNKLYSIKFEGSGFLTVGTINNSAQPMNVFDCWGMEIRGTYGAAPGMANPVTKLAAGPGTQDLTFSGSSGSAVTTMTARAKGSCHVGSESHVQYDDVTGSTNALNEARLWAYGSGGVSNVQFYVDGVLKGSDATGSLDGDQYEFSVDTTGVTVGWHTLKVTASYSVAPGTTTSIDYPYFFNRRELSAGDSVSCVLGDWEGSHSALQCWGYNDYGQAGLGSTSTTVGSPGSKVLQGERFPPFSPELTFVSDVSVGAEAVCAVAWGNTSGGVYCWGKNTNGILGVSPGTLAYSASPKVIFPTDSGATAVAVGRRHACALFSSGQVRCWGNGARGQLGDSCTFSSGNCAGSVSVPTPPASSFTTAVEIAVGMDTTWVRTSSGDIWSFGRDEYGQLGDGATLANRSVPAKIFTGGATALWGGWFHACAKVSGVLKCWGSNINGEVGNGTTASSQPTPVTATAWNGYTVRDMYLGDEASCIVTTGNIAKCLGTNVYGNLGLGYTSTNVLTPSAPPVYGSGVRSMALGLTHQCAFIEGAYYCQGDNTYDQVRSDAGSPQLTPFFVAQ